MEKDKTIICTKYHLIQYKLRKMWKEKEDKQLLALLNIYGKNWKLIKKFMKTRSSK